MPSDTNPAPTIPRGIGRLFTSSKFIAAAGALIASIIAFYLPNLPAGAAESLATKVVYLALAYIGATGLEDAAEKRNGAPPPPP